EQDLLHLDRGTDLVEVAQAAAGALQPRAERGARLRAPDAVVGDAERALERRDVVAAHQRSADSQPSARLGLRHGMHLPGAIGFWSAARQAPASEGQAVSGRARISRSARAASQASASRSNSSV